jgi:MFS family permease
MEPPAFLQAGGTFMSSRFLTSVGRALRHRNYRLFFIGQSISLIGTWMTQVAAAWLVYRLTRSVAMLGFVGFSGQIATFLLAPVAGVLTDRADRHKILIATQVFSMLQSFALAFLALAGVITVWQIILLSVAQGVISAFDLPARQSLVVDLVPRKEDLSNAIGLNASVFNGARLIGPPVAGFVIALGGEGACFLVDGISYIAVIVMLLAMRDLPKRQRAKHVRVLEGFAQGLRYVRGFAPIRILLLSIAFTSVIAMPYGVLMPAFAKEILHGDANLYGLLMGATGLGAFSGSIYLASRRSARGLLTVAARASAFFGCGLIGLSAVRSPWIGLLVLFFIGFGMIVQMAATNTVLQTLVDDDKRGRVMSLFTTASMGMYPWGALMIGGLAQRIGVPGTLCLSGLLCVAGAVLLWSQLPALRKVIRPIYVKMGIIVEVGR